MPLWEVDGLNVSDLSDALPRESFLANGRDNAGHLALPFNPKPEAMAGAACGRSIPPRAIASGFGLNEGSENSAAKS